MGPLQPSPPPLLCVSLTTLKDEKNIILHCPYIWDCARDDAVSRSISKSREAMVGCKNTKIVICSLSIYNMAYQPGGHFLYIYGAARPMLNAESKYTGSIARVV